MKKNKSIIFIFMAIATLFGCEADKFNTSHPNEGGVVLIMDWSNVESTIPSTYQVFITPTSGKSKMFDNLSGTSNTLVIDPGEAVLYVYNRADNITVTGEKAILQNAVTGLTSNPGLFYSFTKRIFTERDKDIDQVATMVRQTGELRFSIAIKPASIIDKIRTVSAELTNVASELNMQNNELSTPASLSLNFSKSGYYYTSTIRSFGFIKSSQQNLHLTIEFANGNRAFATSNLSQFATLFNESKNALFTLNASMVIPDENATTLAVDTWEYNMESRYLSVSTSAIELQSSVSSQSVSIITDQPSWEYSITQTGNWLSTTKSANQITLLATANTGASARQATVSISTGGLSEKITITQKASSIENDYYKDKEIIKLQSDSVGKGVNIILMGDGYTINEMQKGTGKYEVDMRKAVEHFFSVYPLSAYRNFFNVYMMTAISNQAGISNSQTGAHLDTKFQTVWEGVGSTLVSCNDDIVEEYLIASGLPLSTINDMTVIMPINANIYAGTCWLYYNPQNPGDFGNGFSICLCPVGYYFKEIVVHEGVGHGFAKADDEYINFPNEVIPQEEMNEIKQIKKWGWFENVDFSSDILQTSWKGFAGLSKYEMVSTFEGAAYYGKGVWRPEFNSCMNNNILYFNAPTRWAMVRRLHRLAGINYSFSQFLIDDKIPVVPKSSRSAVEVFIPLARPVIKAK